MSVAQANTMSDDPQPGMFETPPTEAGTASEAAQSRSWAAAIRASWPIAVVALGLVATLVWCIVLVVGLFRVVEWAVDPADLDHTGSSHQLQEDSQAGEHETAPEPDRHESSTDQTRLKGHAAPK